MLNIHEKFDPCWPTLDRLSLVDSVKGFSFGFVLDCVWELCPGQKFSIVVQGAKIKSIRHVQILGFL